MTVGRTPFLRLENDVQADEIRAFADAVQAAADTVFDINRRDGAGPDVAWRAKDLAGYARDLRQEADEL